MGYMEGRLKTRHKIMAGLETIWRAFMVSANILSTTGEWNELPESCIHLRYLQ